LNTCRGYFPRAVVAALGTSLVAWVVWISWPGEKAPWWYTNSQAGWEHEHAITPVGFDEVSQYLIKSHGISVVPWKPNQFWAYLGSADRHHQWIGDKLLVRMLEGKDSFFGGGDELHPPLKFDPHEQHKTLREALADEDDGKLHFVERGKSVFEMIEDSGGKVIR